MKTAKLTLFTLFVYVLAVVINFNGFLQGSPAAAINITVTIIYLATWILLTVTWAANKQRSKIYIVLIHWCLVLLISLAMIFANISDFNADIILPLVIILITPLYGISIPVFSDVLTLIVTSVIACAFIIYSVFSIKHRDNSSKLSN